MTTQTLRKQHIQMHLNKTIVQFVQEIIFLTLHVQSSTLSVCLSSLMYILFCSSDISINEKKNEEQVNIIINKAYMRILARGNIYSRQENVHVYNFIHNIV